MKVIKKVDLKIIQRDAQINPQIRLGLYKEGYLSARNAGEILFEITENPVSKACFVYHNWKEGNDSETYGPINLDMPLTSQLKRNKEGFVEGLVEILVEEEASFSHP
jgi:hypothetical protein